MKIGLFTDTYYPQINGVVTSTQTLKGELERRGHEVYVFTTTDPDAKEIELGVFRLPSMPFVFLPSHRMNFIYPPKLVRSFKKLNLDIVHTQTEFPIGIFGKIMSKFYGIPVVHTYHTMYEDYVHYVANGHLITPKMAQRISRVFCNRSDLVIAPVEKTRDSLIEYGVVCPVVVIPTGINFEPFSPEKYSKEEVENTRLSLGLNLVDPVIIYIGRVAKEKSIEVIIKEMPKILEKLPDTKFVIVGDGPLLEDLKKLAKEIGVDKAVIFTGKRPWSEIGKYYHVGDVFVNASMSETQGLTYYEAMASKITVIGKRDRSVENAVIHGETGYLFDKDEDAAQLICSVLENKEEAEKIAENGYKSVQWLSAQRFAADVEKAYLEAIELRKAKGKSDKKKPKKKDGEGKEIKGKEIKGDKGNKDMDKKSSNIEENKAENATKKEKRRLFRFPKTKKKV